MSKRALITGIAGQDGTYLAELLLDKGYHVYGLAHGQSHRLLSSLAPYVNMVAGDLLDHGSLIAALEFVQPDEVYNLGAISFVPVSFEQPELTFAVNQSGVLRLLTAIRIVSRHDRARGESAGIRFYQASSSEMFGNAPERPQNESTSFKPLSPYGAAKAAAHYITQQYRENYGMFAVAGICFNHESERRREEFVSRKVTNGVARIKLKMASELRLGNPDAVRDWGFAGDYVQAMHLMLQADEPQDYVLGTGVGHSVRELVELAFSYVDLNPEKYVKWDPTLRRIGEVHHLVADTQKARHQLGWSASVSFEALIQRMVESDLKMVSAEIKA